MRLTPAVDPPTEPCADRVTEATGFFDAPTTLIDCRDPYCGWLIAPLRLAAQEKDAEKILVRAAFECYVLQHPELWGVYPRGPDELSMALADLSVTGREAYLSFSARALREADLITPVFDRLRQQIPTVRLDNQGIKKAVREVLQRAYQVAWALRGPVAHRRTARDALGWIAVAGVQDPPHRPVNVPSALFPQRNTTVQVGAHAVVTRYLVASQRVSDEATVDLATIPPDGGLPRIVGDVIVFIHGHSSSAEEAMPLIGPLLAQASDQRRPVTLIAMDLPSNGYASMIEHTSIADPTLSRWNTGYPILGFIEDFIVAFVDRLEAMQPGIKRQILGVIGGSLGGNMTLRLGRRDPALHPWLHSVVSWSPASTWMSWARAVLGPPQAGRFYDFVKHEGVGRTSGAMMAAERETPHSRSSLNKFFYEEFAGKKVGRIAQSDHWFSESWPCREDAKTGSHRAVYEIYNALFRRWHWRVAHEQLIYSHWDSDNTDPRVDPDPRNNSAAGDARYSQIKSRVLLATGYDDDLPPERLFRETEALAKAMTMVDGTAMFLKHTGHAMPTERPIFFASLILGFLFERPPPPTDVSYLAPLLLEERLPAVDLSFLAPLLLDEPPITAADVSFLTPLL